jgi:hypothetical protein
MRLKKYLVLAVFIITLLSFSKAEAANGFITPIGPNAENSALGFSLTYGPTENAAVFQGEVTNFPVGEQGIIGAFVFAGGQEICIGLTTINADKEYRMQIYGDDPQTPTVEGAQEGNRITFKAIINGELSPLVPVGEASYVWEDNQPTKQADLNIEKAGLEGELNNILPGGLGAVASGGTPPAELDNLTFGGGTGGFGVPLDESPDTPPVIPEPATIIMFFGGLLFKYIFLHLKST